MLGMDERHTEDGHAKTDAVDEKRADDDNARCVMGMTSSDKEVR